MPANLLEVRNVSKSYSSAGKALIHLDFDLRDQELLAILGKSGAGKSTLLRVIAGLDTPDEGEIFLDGKSLREVPPHLREVGMVFQDIRLYPHLTVRENLHFGARTSRSAALETDRHIQDLAERLQIIDLLSRYPNQLSGGEQQRVALGRALARGPKLLLLDEPLAHLDVALKHDLRKLLRELPQALGVSMIYVTHDQAEALSMGDRVAVMQQGRVSQCGTPQEVYMKPTHIDVAKFIGDVPMNLFAGTLSKCTHGLKLAFQSLQLDITDTSHSLENDLCNVLIGVRPESFREVTDASSLNFRVSIAINDVQLHGSDCLIQGRWNDSPLLVLMRSEDWFRRSPCVEIEMEVTMKSLHIFAQDSGERIALDHS